MGKLIVIDGIDGSGKATQAKLLVERLREEGHKTQQIDFPQYGSKSAGPVEEYLNGRYGTADEVGPYPASVLYAVDRFAAKKRMEEWLSQHLVIISNRYVSANRGHQAGKIDDPAQRKEYIDWLMKLEFSIFRIPEPDLNIYLKVEPEIAQRLVEKKTQREYIEGGKAKDIHEADLSHLQKSHEAFSYAARMPGWATVECCENGQILAERDIHERIWWKVKEVLG